MSRYGESNVYDIECNGRIVQKHVDHLKSRMEPLLIIPKGKYSGSCSDSKEHESHPRPTVRVDHSTRALQPTVVQSTSMSKPNFVQSTYSPRDVMADSNRSNRACPVKLPSIVVNNPELRRSERIARKVVAGNSSVVQYKQPVDNHNPVMTNPIVAAKHKAAVNKPPVEPRRSARLAEKAGK